MELVNANKLGVAKGTEVEAAVIGNVKGETEEVGLYLAIARHHLMLKGLLERFFK
jgi:hypothetical protein